MIHFSVENEEERQGSTAGPAGDKSGAEHGKGGESMIGAQVCRRAHQVKHSKMSYILESDLWA